MRKVFTKKSIMKVISSTLAVTLFIVTFNMLAFVPAAKAAPTTIYTTDFTGFSAGKFPTIGKSPNVSPDVDTIISDIASAPSQGTKWYSGYLNNGTLVNPSNRIVIDATNGVDGSAAAKIANTTGSLIAATVGISTSGYYGITVSYWDRGLLYDRNVYFQYSTDAGRTWKTFDSDGTTVTSGPPPGTSYMAGTTVTSGPPSTPTYTAKGSNDFPFIQHTFNISDVDSAVNDNAFCLFRVMHADSLTSAPTTAVSVFVDDFSVTGNQIPSPQVSSMILNNSTATIAMGQTLKMAVTSVLPADATGLSVKWTSAEPTIAKVDILTGEVTPLKVGTTTITATNALTNVTSDCKLTVIPGYVPASGISLDKTSLSLYTGQTSLLTATVTPDTVSNNTVIWSTDDPSVATVDATGLVSGVSVGTTKVRATSEDKAIYFADCQVTVNAEKDSNRAITTFGFTNNTNGVSSNPRAAGFIDQTAKTITVYVPKGTDISNLQASYVGASTVKSVWENNTQQPIMSSDYALGTPTDYRKTVTYTVYGSSSTPTSYTVTVQPKAPISRVSQTFIASTPADISTYCKQAIPGDTILMKNGTWTDADIYFVGDGEKDSPITLKAETQGQVILQGASRVTISGSYLVADGLNFSGRSTTKLDSAVKFDRLAYNSRLTNTVINDYNTTNTALVTATWLIDYGTYNRIDHSTFEHQANLGNILKIWRGIDSHCTVDHNIFANRDFPAGYIDGGNGTEAIQVGMYLSTGTWDTAPSHSIIENNYFYNWKGDIECISVKSHNNIIRYNTFRACQTTVTLRIADNCEVYGNYFLDDNTPNAGGIRVYGSGHKIYNNYFSGTSGSGDQRGAIALHTGAAYKDDQVLQDDCQPARNVIVAFNTIVNSNGNSKGGAISLGAAPGITTVNAGTSHQKDILKTVPPQNCIIANNIILGTTATAFYTPAYSYSAAPSITYEGNIIYGVPSGFSDLPDGITVDNPLLSKSAGTEVFRPEAESPALSAASSLYDSYDFIKDDFEGQVRTAVKDIGADQLSLSARTRKILTEQDVGPVKGITGSNGTSDNTFESNQNIIRADFIKLLVDALGLIAKVDDNFVDVKSTDSYYNAVGISKKLGITTGVGDNKLEPTSLITRQDMIMMTARALKLVKKLDVIGSASDLSKFADKGEAASYAADSIAAMVKSKLVLGNGTLLNPLDSTTKAEAAIILNRIKNR